MHLWLQLLHISIHLMLSWLSVWLCADEAVTPDVYRSFSLCWIYFCKSIQICFCAAYCTRGVNVLYKVFRSGIRFSPNSISQFSVLSRAFIILTVADKAIIFLEQLQNVDKCFCDSVSVWGGNTNIIPPVTDGTYCLLQSDILCNTKETDVMSICVSKCTSAFRLFTANWSSILRFNKTFVVKALFSAAGINIYSIM